jgi:hypothetical protein
VGTARVQLPPGSGPPLMAACSSGIAGVVEGWGRTGTACGHLFSPGNERPLRRLAAND